ncbi:alpha/beta hydrolase [Actinoplanes sp. NPDC051861]|uniref:alpha/beta fold hydrolase n=1 Tax=Actinoplanes sp. NPDC051861 TaxID=3155170 RepID=UPI003415FA68
MTETFVTSGSLRLWTERIGDPDHPAVLLIAGQAAQGYCWPDALVGRLVASGAQVIRFDHRDTGLSSTVDFDTNPYDISEMSEDVVAILDAYRLPSAHIVGASLGGVLAQWLGVHRPARVSSLTLLSTTPMGEDPGPPSPRFLQHLAGAAGTPHGVESDIALFRVMNGDVRPFDEPAARAVLERCWARALDPAAAAHHGPAAWREDPNLLAPLSAITAPTLVVHGDQDPIFTVAKAEALVAAIPDARLHVVPGMGHVYFSPGLPELLADLIRRPDSPTPAG